MTAPANAARKPSAANPQQAAPAPQYPFPVGVYESVIQDYDNTIALGATVAAWTAPILCPLWNVSPTGWLRNVWLDFVLTVAGNAATPVLKEDAPFSLVQKLTVYDLGNVVVMQLTGYEWYLVNKYGGYFNMGDAKNNLGTFAVTTGSGGSAGSVSFTLAVPFEQVARDSLGTVQNESKPGWKIELYIDSAANVYSTQPTGTGTASLRVRGYPESYTEPASAAPNGRQFAQTPPLPGTIANWRSENETLPAGNAKHDVANGIGYPIRNIIFYGHDNATGTRATAEGNWPDPAQFTLGSVVLFNVSKRLWKNKVVRDFDYFSAAEAANGIDNAVYPIAYTKDGWLAPGAELRFKYLDTNVNSALRFSGSFNASTVFFALVNWLAIPNRNRYSLISGK